MLKESPEYEAIPLIIEDGGRVLLRVKDDPFYHKQRTPPAAPEMTAPADKLNGRRILPIPARTNVAFPSSPPRKRPRIEDDLIIAPNNPAPTTLHSNFQQPPIRAANASGVSPLFLSQSDASIICYPTLNRGDQDVSQPYMVRQGFAPNSSQYPHTAHYQSGQQFNHNGSESLFNFGDLPPSGLNNRPTSGPSHRPMSGPHPSSDPFQFQLPLRSVTPTSSSTSDDRFELRQPANSQELNERRQFY
jgi:hypothetical protein